MSNALNMEIRRVGAVLAGLWLALLALAGVLWHEQVAKSQEHRLNQAHQSVRRVRLPAVRGLIYDRRGACLARNRPSYCLALYVEELRQAGRLDRTVDAIERTLMHVSAVIGLPREVSREDIFTHLRKRMPLPFLAWRDISPEALARWAETGAITPGVDVYVQPVREYPAGESLAHVLGYIGRADLDADDIEGFHYYMPEMEGKVGIERARNADLEGEAGGRLLRVDASGFKYDEIAEKPPREGAAVFLTVDLDVQRAAEAALDGDRAAAVVLDPRNGDVLAMASAPGFNPNSFSPSISAAEWAKLNADEGRPLFNRAVSAYPPGSTFKPLVAFAALENGCATTSTEYACPGVFTLGPLRLKCWNELGHGTLAMRKAIEQSCNVYFCNLGLATGYERIYHMAEAAGLGRRTGIELSDREERSGLLPNDAWKRRTFGDRWRAGDTCNASIGQGAIAVTPLQMAMVTAAIANGGTVYRPRLIRGPSDAGAVVNRMNWSAASLDVVRSGMYDVIQAPTGSGRLGRIDGVEMAGKTGTAEYGPRSNRRRHVWMTVFAPYSGPRYAVAVFVEDGLSGGRTVAPRVQALMTRLFQIEQERRAEKGGGV